MHVVGHLPRSCPSHARLDPSAYASLPSSSHEANVQTQNLYGKSGIASSKLTEANMNMKLSSRTTNCPKAVRRERAMAFILILTRTIFKKLLHNHIQNPDACRVATGLTTDNIRYMKKVPKFFLHDFGDDQIVAA